MSEIKSFREQIGGSDAVAVEVARMLSALIGKLDDGLQDRL